MNSIHLPLAKILMYNNGYTNTKVLLNWGSNNNVSAQKSYLLLRRSESGLPTLIWGSWVSECLIMKDILSSQSLIGGALINVKGPQVFFFQAVAKL